ncbi:polyphosphate kinase 2 family protein [Thiolinea disciformis]|uniref:polyphosphate kinase 2 family protein n=1 Tax=Thiolinea disciformis TaxID=125614 RepID=UPI00036DD7D9|nr:polyphosphate kinase 2 family protein [Thiolinea disciformis]
MDFPKPYRVPFDGKFSVANAKTKPAQATDKDNLKKQLKQLVKELAELQEMLYAQDQYALLLIFQAMDAAGKDGTISAVLSGVNPAGIQVVSFKQPSAEELDHDFLWRTTKNLPERGRIGVFNRSYYEEVLVVRVHPEYLSGQQLPPAIDKKTIWQDRYESIRHHETHLAKNGVVLLKFWLNVSKDEQKKRFLARLDAPEKNWKFSAGDVAERQHWDQYMEAYEAALKETSSKQAPWYAIPADDKDYMRVQVAQIIVDTLKSLKLAYPTITDKERSQFAEARRLLESE